MENNYSNEFNKETNLRFNYNVMDANKSFFYVILMNLLAPFAMYIFLILLNIFGGLLSDVAYSFVYNMLITLIIPSLYLLLIIIFHQKQKIDLNLAIKYDKKINPIIIFLILLICGLCVICFFPFINMIYMFLEKLGFNMSGDVAFEMNNWWTLILGIIMLCLLPALVEEIIFRGIMMGGLLKRVKPHVAIILSATAFFIMHGSIQQSFYQIILGFVLSILFYITGNIFYSIIFHFLNNLIVVLLSYFNIGGFLNGFSISVGGILGAIGLFLLGVAAIIGILIVIKQIQKRKKTLEFVVDGNNIIIEENDKKLGFKEFSKSLILDEKFYFKSAWIIAIVMWILNSI